ncbi:MAG: hypothetical protein QW625_03390, partial [Candidatus Nanoarchaeia archaeon]
NEGPIKEDDDFTMISNDPEIIPEEGILFSGELKNFESARLLYYHSNLSGETYNLVTSIYNPSDFPIEILTYYGIGGPSEDGLYAGHVATYRFMDKLKYNAGKIIRINPKEKYNLIEQNLGPNLNIGTAIAKIWLVSGIEAKIEITSTKQKIKNNLKIIKCTWDNGRISHFIPESKVDIEKEITSDKKSIEIRIGEDPVFVSEKRGFDIHLGNYGLLHKIKLKLTNNQKSYKNFSILYSAKGGLSRGIFLINNTIYETGLLGTNSKNSEKLFSLVIPPNSSKFLEILMLPQPGSYYPTVLTIQND